MTIGAVRTVALWLALLSCSALAQSDLTPPPMPPPEPVVAPRPPEIPPQPVIANAPLEPEPPRERFGMRFGPMGHVGFNFAPWAGLAPGFAGTLGLRFALLPRTLEAQLNVAASAFFGFESINYVPTFSPGLRVELVGVRGPVMIPYLSLGAFGQLLAPANGDPVAARVGLAFSWNIVAALSGGGGGGSLGNLGNLGGAVWLIPVVVVVAIVAAVITFGDVRCFIQTNPGGDVIGGLSIGVGF